MRSREPAYGVLHRWGPLCRTPSESVSETVRKGLVGAQRSPTSAERTLSGLFLPLHTGHIHGRSVAGTTSRTAFRSSRKLGGTKFLKRTTLLSATLRQVCSWEGGETAWYRRIPTIRTNTNGERLQRARN